MGGVVGGALGAASGMSLGAAAATFFVPGVGPVTAQKIIDARSAAPFNSADELRRVKGIGPKMLESLRPFVVVK